MTSDAGRTTAAFFDVDGTIVDATIAHYLRYFMWRYLPAWKRPIWDSLFLVRCAYYILVDRLDRTRFNELFYRNYRGLPADAIRALATECDRQVIAPRTFAEALDCIGMHREAGRRIVLVSGSLDFIMQPFARRIQADHLEAAALMERNGVFTGELEGAVVGTHEKARRVREYAHGHDVDLAHSHAYGDSVADLPMLEAVGFPHAVNPDKHLRQEASNRGWPIETWTHTNHQAVA